MSASIAQQLLPLQSSHAVLAYLTRGAPQALTSRVELILTRIIAVQDQAIQHLDSFVSEDIEADHLILGGAIPCTLLYCTGLLQADVDWPYAWSVMVRPCLSPAESGRARVDTQTHTQFQTDNAHRRTGTCTFPYARS